MRVFLAMLSHETNTFSNVPTDRAQFEARDLRYGGEIVETYRGTGTCLGGMIDGGRAPAAWRCCRRWRPPPRRPGCVTRDIYEHVKQRMLADLAAAGRLDGVLLDLHGAMVPEGMDDGEGDIIAAVRRAVGPDVPIAVTLDFHGNLARGHGRAAPISCTATRPTRTWTWPSAAWRRPGGSLDVIAGRIRPTAAWRKPPLLPPLGSQGTARGPDAAPLRPGRRDGEETRSVISVSIFAGFPYADIPDAGLGIYVVTDDDQALAERLAERLARRGVGAPARVHPHRAAREGRGGQGARRRRPARSCSPTWPTTRAAARRATAPRSCASCCGWARARAVGGVHLGRGRGAGVREGGRRRLASRSTWAARWTTATGRRCG